MTVKIDEEALKEVLDWNRGLGNYLSGLSQRLSESKLQEIAVGVGISAVPFISALTPIETGSWASSWMVTKGEEDSDAFIVISPWARNPKTKKNPKDYGPEVHQMGGKSKSGHQRNVLTVFIGQYRELFLDELEDGVTAVFSVKHVW